MALQCARCNEKVMLIKKDVRMMTVTLHYKDDCDNENEEDDNDND